MVQYNQGSNSWSNLKRWPIDDGQLTPNALTSGDLNGDGQTDLVLLGIMLFTCSRKRRNTNLAEAERIPYSGAVKSVQVLDINGDKRDDDTRQLGRQQPIPFSPAKRGGTAWTRGAFSLPPIRSYWADDLDNDSKTEIITIARIRTCAISILFAKRRSCLSAVIMKAGSSARCSRPPRPSAVCVRRSQ